MEEEKDVVLLPDDGVVVDRAGLEALRLKLRSTGVPDYQAPPTRSLTQATAAVLKDYVRVQAHERGAHSLLFGDAVWGLWVRVGCQASIL